MAEFSHTFTGKGTAVRLPESGAVKAYEGLSKMILDAEKLRYEVYQKNYSEFLKNTDIDPGFIMSDSARKYMNERILNYSAKYGKKMQENNGVLSIQDKSDMQTERNLIESERDGLLMDQELLTRHQALIEKDMGVNFSQEEFNKAREEYVRGDSKRWNYTINDFLKPKDFVGAYSSSVAKINRLYYDTKNAMMPVGGGKATAQGTPFQSKEDAMRHFAYMISADPRMQKDYFERWATADKEKYNRQAEENTRKLGVESWETNPMLLFVADMIGEDKINPLLQDKPTTIPGLRRSGDTTGFDKKLPVSATNNKHDEYDVQKDQIFESVTLPTFLNFAPDETSAKTQSVQSYIDLATGEERTLNKTATFKVVGYSPDKDLIVVNLTKDIPGQGEGYLMAVKDIALRGALYDDFIRNRFGIHRESLLKKYGGRGNEIPPLIKRPETSNTKALLYEGADIKRKGK